MRIILKQLTCQIYIHGGTTNLENTEIRFIYDLIRNSFKKLENFCNDIVVKYPNLIFDADDFTSLKESALVSLVKRDDLRMKEIRIWDYIIKWELRLFTQTLMYLSIPDRPVKSTILPPRSVLVTELPLRTNEPKETFSTIISEDHAAEISGWIDRKTTTHSATNTPDNFELILCGKDGFAPQTFEISAMVTFV
ncbi:hypothetical protein Glove_84g33 [Diversispora epigaea]|uniref:BACK domain-containing protein n=1 Tax=Diversispora epigaea TaxID=1348612 RepID=A0A397JAV5_9GLOM|nr:hypothetical protein Glove_84g33 [Diversispora epigaea]